MSHRNNFTLLRLILAIMIAVGHGYAITGHPYNQPISPDSKMWRSVILDMFFFISGYLVTGSALQSKNFFSFLMKRVLRIYPALIVTVLFTVFVLGAIFSTFSLGNYFTSPVTWKYLFTLSGIHIEYSLPALFKSNPDTSVNSSLWTLALELKLYLGLSLCYVTKFLFTKYYRWVAVVLALFFTTLAVTGFTIKGDAYNIAMWPLIAIFLTGSAMQMFKCSLKIIVMLFMSSFIILGLQSAGILLYRIYIDELIFYSTLALLLANNFNLGFYLKNDYSYGLYLYAFPIQQVLVQLSGNKMHPAVNIALTLLIAGCIAVLSWKYIEKPSLNLKKYLN